MFSIGKKWNLDILGNPAPTAKCLALGKALIQNQKT